MKSNDVNTKRLIRVIRSIQDCLQREAHCFRYDSHPDYLDLKEDLKFVLGMLENGEDFAGKLLFKNIRSLSPKATREMAERAKFEEEQVFFSFVANLNEQRIAKADPNYRRKLGEPIRAWKIGAWGAHICPYCGFGEAPKEEYIGTPYKYCPDCGRLVAKPEETQKEEP